jgi:hypothetical protein
MAERPPLTSDDLAQMEHRARRFSRGYTGTAATLAADVIRLLIERRRLLGELSRCQAAEASQSQTLPR